MLESVLQFVETQWLFFGAGGLLLAMRLLARVTFLVQRKRAAVRNAPVSLEDLPLESIAKPTEEDELATAVIRRYRKAVVTRIGFTTLSWEELREQCRNIIVELADVYRKNDEQGDGDIPTFDPILDLHPREIVILTHRVATRLHRSFEREPLRQLASWRVRDFVDAYRWFEPWYQHYRQHRRKLEIASWGWTATRAALAPWLTVGTKLAWTAGQEALIRKLFATVLTIVGEEARRLFRDRYISESCLLGDEIIFAAALNLALSDGQLSTGEYRFLVELLADGDAPPESKDRMLRWLHDGAPVAVSWALVSGTEHTFRQQMMTALERLANSDEHGRDARWRYLNEVESHLGIASGLKREKMLAGEWGTGSRMLGDTVDGRTVDTLRLGLAAAQVAGTVEQDEVRLVLMNYLVDAGKAEPEAVLARLTDTLPSPHDVLVGVEHWQSPSKRSAGLALCLDVLFATRPVSRNAQQWLMDELGPRIGGRSLAAKRLFQRLDEAIHGAGIIGRKPEAEVLGALFGCLQSGESIELLASATASYAAQELVGSFVATSARLLFIEGGKEVLDLGFVGVVRYAPGRLQHAWTLDADGVQVSWQVNALRVKSARAALERLGELPGLKVEMNGGKKALRAGAEQLEAGTSED